MKKELLKKIIEKKRKKIEFSIITNIENGEGCIYEKNKTIDKKLSMACSDCITFLPAYHFFLQ